MCDIYKNALFTIAASRATTGSDGLFSSLDTRLITPCFLPQFHYTSNLGNRFNIHLAPPGGNPYSSVFDNKIEGPLYERAWVLQEEMLSHATLAFTDFGMSWQCFHSTRSSLDPEGSNDQYRMSYLKDAIMLTQRYSRRPEVLKAERDKWEKRGAIGNFQSCRDNIYSDWTETVEKYLMRKVTHPTDRLPALSGLTQGMQEVLSDSYSIDQCIGGIWLHDLERQLLWSPHWTHFRNYDLAKAYKKTGGEERPKRRVHPPQLYLAPSWSWASMYETPISWGNHYWRKEKEEKKQWLWMTNAEWKSQGSNIFGNLESATLTIQGYLLNGFAWDDGMLYESEERGFLLGKFLLDEGGVLGDGKRNVVLMPVLSYEAEQSGYGCMWLISCLVLVPSGLKHGEFRRIGLGLVSVRDAFGVDGERPKSTFFLV